MMQYKFTNCNKCTKLGLEANKQGSGYACGKAQDMGKVLISSQFCFDLKLLLLYKYK